MSGVGKDSVQKDCDSCGDKDHAQQASKGDNWDKTKATDATKASGDGILKKSGDTHTDSGSEGVFQNAEDCRGCKDCGDYVHARKT